MVRVLWTGDEGCDREEIPAPARPLPFLAFLMLFLLLELAGAGAAAVAPNAGDTLLELTEPLENTEP